MMGAVSRTIGVIAKPRGTLGSLSRSPTIAFPLSLVLVSCIAVVVMYYSLVDIVPIIESELAGLRDNPQAAERARESLERIASDPAEESAARMVLLATFAAGAALVLVLVKLLLAGYLLVVSLLTGDGFKLRQWFSLVCWTSVPSVLSSMAAIANMLLRDVSQLPADRVNPLAFSSLLGLDSAGGSVLTPGLTGVWSLALLVSGYAIWTKRSPFFSVLVVASPIAVLLAVYLLTRTP